MIAILEPQHLCPKCGDTRRLSEFKLRSRSQGRSPAWCKECRNRQDRIRRARQREREINEFVRRIRFGSPPDHVLTLLNLAADRAGGVQQLADRLGAALMSRRNSIALRASRLVTIMLAAADRAKN